MKHTLTFAALSALFLSAPAFAGDGHVSTSTLQSLGLGQMQVISDADGMQVRGMSKASAWGTSIVTGLLLDPDTKSFVIGTDANKAGSIASGYSKHGNVAYQTNASYVDLALFVDTNYSSFSGVLYGGAGGSSYASGH